MNSSKNNSQSNLADFAISVELFDWVRKNINENSTILEFGSGTGTIELCKFYKLYSVEHNPEWVGHCAESNYIHAPILDYGSYHWYDKDIVKANIPENYDLIIIDGPPNNPDTEVIGRYGFIENIDLFDQSVPMIFDDVNRDDEYQNMLDASQVLDKPYEIHKGWQKSFGVIK